MKLLTFMRKFKEKYPKLTLVIPGITHRDKDEYSLSQYLRTAETFYIKQETIAEMKDTDLQ